MRRRPHPARVSLVLAVLVTSLAVALGTLLVPAPGPGGVDEATGTTTTDTAGRSSTVSRDRSRPAGRPVGSTGSPSAVARPETAAPSAGSAGDAVPSATASAEPGQVAVEPPPPFKLQRARGVLRRLPPGPVPGDPFDFQIGTLNILGSQHRGNGAGRAAALAGAITGRGVDVVGLQEVQDDQLAVLQARLPGYTIWPGQSLGNQGVRLQIAFRNELFELVDTGSITTTFDFQQRPIPWVLLRDRATGGEFHVIDVHNSPGGQSRDRYAATTEEIGLVGALRESGKTVFLVGDTNEHTTTACRIAGATGMVGSNGLSSSGGCSPGVGPIKIDHVLGVGGVDFSGHVVDYGAPVPASTDHAFVHASVTVTPLVSQDQAADLD